MTDHTFGVLLVATALLSVVVLGWYLWQAGR